jgi:hypothetical protein
MLCKIVGSNCKKVLRGEVRMNLVRVNTLTSNWPFFTFMKNLLLQKKELVGLCAALPTAMK